MSSDILVSEMQSVDVSAGDTHALVFLYPVIENSTYWGGTRITGSFKDDKGEKDDRKAVAALCKRIPGLVINSGGFGGVVTIKSIASEKEEDDKRIQIFLVS